MQRILLWSLALLLAPLPVAGAGPARVQEAAAEATGFRAAWRLYQAGEPCIEAFEAVLADPAAAVKERFNAAYTLGVLRLGRDEPAEALALFGRADALLPGLPQVALRKSEALIRLGRLEDAERILIAQRAALGKDAEPRLRTLLALDWARLYLAFGDAERALSELAPVARERPDEWEPHFVLATVYERLDRPADALAEYEIAIENDPGRDPHPGVWALQRWASLAVSSDRGSYDDAALKARVLARYAAFLERARANAVPEEIVAAVRQAADVLERFGAPPQRDA